MKNEELFSGKANNYRIARPKYPSSCLEFLSKEFGFGRHRIIADIGSGTGIFTTQLLETGAEIYAVEPNLDMRLIAEESLNKISRFHSVNGTAEYTSLNDQSVDYVTAAQSFHWFNAEMFKKECLRILKKDGMVFLLWNLRMEDAPISIQCAEVFRKYCPRFKGYNTGMKAGDPRISDFFEGKFQTKEFDFPLTYDGEHFLTRYLSSSYSLKEGERGFEKCIKEVKQIFDIYQENGTVTVPNKTYLYFGRID